MTSFSHFSDMADLTVEVKIKNSTKDGADSAKRAVKSIGDEAQNTARRTQSSLAKIDFSGISDKLKNVGSQITGIGQRLTVGLSLPIAAVTTLGLRFNATKEQALVSFGVLLKSGEKAKQLFADLTKFAADTPFEMPEINTAAKSLLAFGVAQEQIIPTMTKIGDIASGLNIPMTELAEIYGKAKTQGRLFAEDINQLTGRGIPIIQELAKQFGVSESEVRKLVESGKVGFPQLEKAFTSMTGEGGQFNGMMAAQSKTFSGLMSTLADNANVVLGQLTEPLFNFISKNLPAVIEVLSNIGEVFSGLSEPAKIVITAIAGLAAALGPVLIVIGTIITAVGALVGAIGSIASGIVALGGLKIILPIAAAIGVAIAGVILFIGQLAVQAYILYKVWQTNFGGIREYTTQVWSAITKYIDAALAAIQQLVNEIGGDIVAWWQENYPLIQQTIAKVSQNISLIIARFLAAFQQFWDNHGDTIITIVRAAWNIISTIIRTVVQVILQTIKGFMQIINGDWAGAWETMKDITAKVISAIGVILKNLLVIIGNVLKLILQFIYNVGVEIYNKAVELGKNLIQGVINGIASLANYLWEKARSVIKGVINIFSSEAQTQSPSKITTQIGEWIAEGLGIGIKNKAQYAITQAKNLAKDVLNEFKNAVKEFEKYAGASPEIVQAVQSINRIKQATSDQQEIINLRGQLGINQFNPLPSSVAETEREIAFLRQKKQENEEYLKSLEDIEQGFKDLQKEIEESKKAFDEKLQSMRDSGALELLNLQQEIDLTGVTNEMERQRITNYYNILKLREQMSQDGFGQAQIDEAAELLRLEQARQLELKRVLEIRKQVVEAGKLEEDLRNRLSDLQNGNRELSEYEKTLRRINEDLKDISPQQKENLLLLAQQIDQQKKFNETYQKTYDFIRGTFDILLDSGKSFKDKLKDIFTNILNSFKKMLVDMATAWLTSKLMSLIFGQGQSGGGGFFGNILSTILNGGGLGGGGSASGGSASGGSRSFISFGGGNSSGTTHGGGHGGGAGPAGGRIGGGLAGGIAVASIAANLIGGAIGGRLGNVISMAGTGLGIGFMFGGPLGAAIGAGAGALFGFLMGDPKRRIDKKENLPKLQEGFRDAFEQLRQLTADKNAFFNDPEGTIQKAKDLRSQIASGFGIQFQSKKYRQIAQQQIAQKLAEADRMIREMELLRDQAVQAREIDQQLNPNFATGVYMDSGFLNQYSQFKRRNGMLDGQFTGRDTLPSMLAMGEMVLNPRQMANVIRNAGGVDVFQNAGIPNYADGAFIGTNQPAQSSPSQTSKQPLQVKIYLSNSGMVESDVLDVVVEGLQDDYELQTELVKTYDKTKRRTG